MAFVRGINSLNGGKSTPKIKFLSFTHLHVISNLYAVLVGILVRMNVVNV